MATKRVSTGRRVFAISVFLLVAAICVIMALAEDAMFPFAFAALFVWLAFFASVPRGQSARIDALVEAVGGTVMLACGILLIVDRANVREMADAGRDRSFTLLYIAAPLLLIGGLFYGLRGIVRLGKGRSD